jgi:transcriptional regulator with XRE-family HTH domain
MSYYKCDVQMENALTPEQVKAARALLAWSQQELASVARVSTSTVADFERGVRTPVLNNAQAIREAFETHGLQFVAGGVVEKAMLPPPPASLRPGVLMRWVNATHLSQWGEQRDGQSGMPELLRRLIYAGIGPAATVHFPSDESVQFPGWDGQCTVAAGIGLVPSGTSVWEISAQRTGIRAKADADFVKRSLNPLGVDPSQTTYVVATPQRFPGKDVWIKEKLAQGPWRDVRVIDGDDLVHWLESYPAVAQWLAVKLRRRPKGLRNIEEVWVEWVRATKTPLTEDIVLTDRDDDATAVLKWLRGAAQLLSVQAEAPDEAMAFLYASISPLPEPYRLTYWSRSVVAATNETARELIGLGTPLIIVLIDPEAGLAQRLVDDGHHVFAAHGPNATPVGATRRLARPWRHNLQIALTRAGLSEEDAHRFARASGRSVTVLRRLMPAAPNCRPKWAEQAPPELIAAMLAGAWVETSAADRKIISAISSRPYNQVEEVLAPLASILDGPLVRSGPVWKVVSLRDLWTQIGGQVTAGQLGRFEAAFHAVLGAINARFDTKPKYVGFDSAAEFGEQPSVALRRGLTETMIALGVYPEAAAMIANADGHADRAIRKLLNKAETRLWWSLSSDFHNLAEASPSAFLDAVENGLEGDDPPIMSLFRSDEGLITSTEYLSELLWSLEMLARSPDYLMQSALLLAHLDEVDPGGKWGNRPAASLRRIFVIWSPQTYATPAQRLKVIDKIIQRHPIIGWKLLIALAPRFDDISEPSSKPNWRDFTPDEREAITWPAVAAAAREIGARLLEHVGNSSSRWRALLELWSNFDPEWRKRAVELLKAFARNLRESIEIEAMREALRGLLQKHRGFADAEWAMAEDDLMPLEEVFKALEPTTPEERSRWLFRSNTNFLRPNVPWEVQRAELEAAQLAAAQELLEALSPERLLAFASTITQHHALGLAVAKASASDDLKEALLQRGLLADDYTSADVSMGILYGLQTSYGEDWVRALWRKAVDENWGERAELRIVRGLPITDVTWAAIEARGRSLGQAYWTSLPVYLVPSHADADYVVENLIAVGRSRAAVEWLGHNIAKKPSGALLTRVLKAAAQSDQPPTDGNDSAMFSHFLGAILNHLETDPTVSEDEVIQLEWIYFQALRYSPRRPRTLHRALARNPVFFVDLIKMIFLPAKDSGVNESPPSNMEQAAVLASHAYDVIHKWAHVPGADDNGIIDGAALETWVKRARKLLAEAGRGEIGDMKIGEILSAAVRVPDQPWPPEPVREIIELTRSRALERGFQMGVYNRRGVTVRSPFAGGELERNLAERYRRDADALRFDWDRTAACLDRIAATYEVDATREDLSAEQRDWL